MLYKYFFFNLIYYKNNNYEYEFDKRRIFNWYYN